MSKTNYLHPDGTFFAIPESGFYKLDTKRHNKTVPSGNVRANDLNVIGSKEIVDRFLAINRLPPLPGEFKGFFGDVTNLELIDKVTIDSMSIFSLQGFKGKIRVTDVIDGDTFDFIAFIQLSTFTEIRTKKKGSTVTALVRTEDKSVGFTAKFRCRMLGIDAFEKISDRGKLAKKLLIDKVKEFNGIMYLEVPKDGEKYGRTLGILYEGHFTKSGELFKKVSVNDFMLNYKDPVFGSLALAYDGGTKSQEAKSDVESAKASKHTGLDDIMYMEFKPIPLQLPGPVVKPQPAKVSTKPVQGKKSKKCSIL